MVYKNIVVIDDVGDMFEPLRDVFEDDSKIKIKHSNSDYDSLNSQITRDTFMILINETGLKNGYAEVIDHIENNSFYMVIPILIITDNEDLYYKAPKAGSFVLNTVLKPLEMNEMKERIRYIIEVLEYNRNINDITGLPGSKGINSKLLYEISQNSKFTLIFLDLDRFKEYGEYYGLYRGSQVMYFLADLIEQTVRQYGSIDDFVGNVGGDDFILILRNYENAEKICNDIIAKFDEQILDFYDGEDLDRGYIETANRKGEMEKIEIMGISVVIMNYTDFRNRSFDEVFRLMNEIKKEAKKINGSVILKS